MLLKASSVKIRPMIHDKKMVYALNKTKLDQPNWYVQLSRIKLSGTEKVLSKIKLVLLNKYNKGTLA